MQYVKIVSSNTIEFIMEIELANQCKFFRKRIKIWKQKRPEDLPSITMKNIKGDVLEIII